MGKWLTRSIGAVTFDARARAYDETRPRVSPKKDATEPTHTNNHIKSRVVVYSSIVFSL